MMLAAFFLFVPGVVPFFHGEEDRIKSPSFFGEAVFDRNGDCRDDGPVDDAVFFQVLQRIREGFRADLQGLLQLVKAHLADVELFHNEEGPFVADDVDDSLDRRDTDRIVRMHLHITFLSTVGVFFYIM